MTLLDPYQVLQVAPNAEQEVIHAAFRALALKYHPDRDPTAHGARRMARLNQAYAMVRDPAARAQYDSGQRKAKWSASPVSAASVPPPRSSSAGSQLEFGRYAGWTLRDLGRHDPDYLRWLARHASGMRYRKEIYQILERLGTTAA